MMEFVRSADGVPIAFAHSGTGPPLLLVHAITVDHQRWAPLLTALEPHFTVYALDRRGRGESGDGPAYSLRIRVLEGQGHVAMDTAPELFVHEVVQFLSLTQ